VGADRQGRGTAFGRRFVVALKKVLLATAALVAAVFVYGALTLPPARVSLAAADDGTVAGIAHVHSNRSDGRGTPDEIAAGAARAGLKFVVFTDHGDATRMPDRPAYRSGVLCVDGVEISTTGGHYVVMDMPPSPYPLGGEARDVVEDVKRLGGIGVAAHPDSPKPELRWTEWTAPFDGIEIVNLDTGWRRFIQAPGWRSRLHLFEALVHYPMRPSETMGALLQPSEVTDQWNALAARRRVMLMAGADAHANLGFRGGDPADTRFSVPFPGYLPTFRTLSIHVRLDRPLSGDAPGDAAIVLRAMRTGHLYTTIDAFASLAAFEFTAGNTLGTVHQGDELGTGGPVKLHVRSNAPREFATTIFAGTRVLAGDRHDPEFEVEAPDAPGVYRVEIRRPGSATPWLVSNPIYVRAPEPKGKLPMRPPSTTSEPLFDGRTTYGWQVETDPNSRAAVEVTTGLLGPELRIRFGLASYPPTGEFAGITYTTPKGVAPNNRLSFNIRAERPMRVSVQLRNWAKPEPERWQRSVYVDTFEQGRTVFFDDLTPVGVTSTSKPVLAEVRSVIFTIDTTNTRPGASGRVWLRNVNLQR
jgi:hypothetical protein